MKQILGLSAFYHDSAAAIVVDGIIIAAAQEERFTRVKHTSNFPTNAIKYCLKEAGLSIDELDAIVFYDKPFLKFERLLETYYAFAPKGLISFLKAIPIWLNENLFLKKQIFDGLKEVEEYQKEKAKLLFTEHHLSHAASTFFASPYHKSAILTVDGVGEWSTASIGIGKANNISIKKELRFPHSLGLLYSSFTYYLGFKVNSGEYKLMGLAPYGNPQSEETQKYIDLIKENIIDIKNDGSIWLNQKYFNYSTGLRMIRGKKWNKLFGFPTRQPEAEIEQHHCNMAMAIQKITEGVVIKMAEEAKKITNCDNLCLAGGVALNCVANGILLKQNIFKNIYIQPAAGDSGGAIGSALSVAYMYFEKERIVDEKTDLMNGSYLGPDYSEKEIELMSRKAKAVYKKHENINDLSEFTAKKISEGNIVGWFQGRMEFGPRALGNRSVLGDARNLDMQKKLNLKIKYRESFRPFAPSVLFEKYQDYFDLERASPYMLFVAPLKKGIRNKLPENYHGLPLKDRLYFNRSKLPAITHLDFSARIQTVNQDTNPRYWNLINDVEKLTGYGVVINTSMNVRGEPIVCTPHEAYRCFMSTEMDYLVINDYMYCKTDQPDWKNKEKWLVNFQTD